MIGGRYTLEREVGRGGMGAVWLGRDEVLGRPVALKRIGMLPGADRTDLDRAEREAHLAARLNHPHVVAVFDLVADADTDARWLVMEYVEGRTLTRLVRDEGPLAPDAAAPLLWQAADGLVAAHEAGIVHRDVKPSNILVADGGRVKITDFGIARIVTEPMLTATGLVTGSPAYLAPEVASGERSDQASDVWSLGATLFHVLAGRPPYDTRDSLLGGLYRIVNEEPPRLAEAGWLAPLLEATMVRDPALRWSMPQVRDYLAGPGEPPRTRTLEAPVVDPPSRPAGRGVPTGLGLAVLVVLVLLMVAVLHRGSTPTRAAGGGPSSGAPSTPAATRSAGPSSSPSVSPSSVSPSSVSPSSVSPSSSGSSSPTSSPSSRAAAAPTGAGMRSFVGRYVSAIASNPDVAFTMLTPKFQQQSGGLRTYRDFWSGVGASHLLSVAANPRTLVVSYRVRFDHFGTGRRPTVLQLVDRGGRYLIDAELTSTT